MVVPVWPRVLVPEANHVSQLVYYDAKLVAVLAYGYGLSPITTLADKRTASKRNEIKCKAQRLPTSNESHNSSGTTVNFSNEALVFSNAV